MPSRGPVGQPVSRPAEWGSMATELLPYYFEAPFHVLMPAAMILLTVLGFHLLAGEDRS